MRFAIKILFALALLVVFAFAAVAFLVPPEKVRDHIVAAVERETGHTLTVAGEASLAFYPSIGVSLGDVTLSGPAASDAGTLLRSAALNVDLKLLPLLFGDVEIDRATLVRPVFDLRIDHAGRPNWRIDRSAAAQPTQAEPAAPAPRKHAALHGLIRPALAQAGSPRPKIEQIRVEDGTVRFIDERSGSRHVFEHVNATVAVMAAAAEVDGSLAWRGETVRVAGRVDELPTALQGGPASLGLRLQAKPLALDFKGTADLAGTARLDGRIEARTAAIGALLDWIGGRVPSGRGPNSLTLSGTLRYDVGAVSLSQGRLSLGDTTTAQGDVTLRFDSPRPLLRASLAADDLDLDAVLTGLAAVAAASARADGRSADVAGGESRPRAQQSLTDFIEQIERQAEQDSAPAAPASGSGDSGQAFDLVRLRGFDADIKISAGAVRYGHLATGRAALAAVLKDGMLTADLADLSLYGGIGSGRLVLNATRSEPAAAARLDLDGVSALPVLKAAMGGEWITGKAKLSLNLTGAGRSLGALLASLHGDASVLIADGALVGIDIARLVRALQEGRVDGWQPDGSERTDFRRLAATFSIEEGVARTDDLDLIAAGVRMTGAGSVHLPRQRIDVSLLPRLILEPDGRANAGTSTAGIPVPLKLQGPLREPRLRPDLDALAKDPELVREAVDGVGALVKKLRKGDGKKVERLLQNLLGGRPATADQEPTGAAGEAASPSGR